MNIQIFGKSKCFDTKKAERYFKERGVKYQYIDMQKYGMSKGEYASVKAALGGFLTLVDVDSAVYKDLVRYLAREEAMEEHLMENTSLFKTPIVRNGKAATVGYAPEVWALWS